MAKFMKYAVAAAEEALTDARWKPTNEHDRERTVRPEEQLFNSSGFLPFS